MYSLKFWHLALRSVVWEHYPSRRRRRAESTFVFQRLDLLLCCRINLFALQFYRQATCASDGAPARHHHHGLLYGFYQHWYDFAYATFSSWRRNEFLGFCNIKCSNEPDKRSCQSLDAVV